MLGPALPHVRVMITEDLRTDRAHGARRFHHRRPFDALVETFTAHGRDNYAAAGPLTIWTRSAAARATQVAG